MELSCFFCQTMLSDFFEEILPASRHQEIKKHLDGCDSCEKLLKDLKKGVDTLQNAGLAQMPQDLVIRLSDTPYSHPLNIFQRPKLSRKLVGAGAAVLGLVALFFAFEYRDVIPFLNRNSKSHFVRYYPMLQGASDILEEQSTWLSKRDPWGASLWEEGGLSPEEFEKTFQPKPASPKGK